MIKYKLLVGAVIQSDIQIWKDVIIALIIVLGSSKLSITMVLSDKGVTL
jgi:hypothetical protein